MSKQLPRKVGRPTKYDPAMCDKAIELMSEGCSQCEVAASLGIHWDTLIEWKKSNPEFSEAIKKGIKLCEAWWEREARIALRDKDFNATLWYMNMKNRFGWRDKHDIESHGSVTVNVNQLDAVMETVDIKTK